MPPSGFGQFCNHYCSRLRFWEDRGSVVPEQATAESYGWPRAVFSSWGRGNDKSDSFHFLSTFFFNSFGGFFEIPKEKTFHLSIT